MGQIYNEFIDAYQEVVTETGRFILSVFLIYTEHNSVKTGPVVVPMNIDLSTTEDEIEKMFKVVVKSFPANEFTLEMMLYANKASDALSGETIVVAGVRDLGGNTVHTVLEQDKITIKTKLVLQKVEGSLLHKWIPPSQKSKKGVSLKPQSITDAFLNMLTTRYAVASSTNL